MVGCQQYGAASGDVPPELHLHPAVKQPVAKHDITLEGGIPYGKPVNRFFRHFIDIEDLISGVAENQSIIEKSCPDFPSLLPGQGRKKIGKPVNREIPGMVILHQNGYRYERIHRDHARQAG
jgi:hypothetical protein